MIHHRRSKEIKAFMRPSLCTHCRYSVFCTFLFSTEICEAVRFRFRPFLLLKNKRNQNKIRKKKLVLNITNENKIINGKNFHEKSVKRLSQKNRIQIGQFFVWDPRNRNQESKIEFKKLGIENRESDAR